MRFSKFAFVLFCYITNRLMTGPLGNSEILFPSILNVSGNKIHYSRRHQSLSVKYFSLMMDEPTINLEHRKKDILFSGLTECAWSITYEPISV